MQLTQEERDAIKWFDSYIDHITKQGKSEEAAKLLKILTLVTRLNSYTDGLISVIQESSLTFNQVIQSLVDRKIKKLKLKRRRKLDS